MIIFRAHDNCKKKKVSCEMNTIVDLFNEYSLGADVIEPEGIIRLFADMQIPVDSKMALALLKELRVAKMGRIQREEFFSACRNEQISCLKELKRFGAMIAKKIDSFDYDRQLYRFVFDFARLEEQKSLSLEVAFSLWEIFLSNKTYHLTHFIEYCKLSKTKIINRDQWNSFYDFCHSFDQFPSEYDESGSWPVLLDSYVSWLQQIN